MSGRSAPNRGKKGHHKQRGFDPDYRQSGNSSNHSGKFGSREQPPRFLNRPRNGDGRSSGGGGSREYNDDYGGGGGRKDGGKGGRLQQGASGSPDSRGGGRANNLEDLMQIVSKLDHAQDVESRCKVSKLLLEFLELHTGDYRLNQVLHIGRNIDAILHSFERVIRNNTDKTLLSNIEKCIGVVGHTLRDSQRLIEWIFYNVNIDENADEAKAVFLWGLYELLCSEGGKSPHAPMLPFVVDNLQSVLEVAESPVLLEVLVKNISLVARLCPQHLAHHFKNTVDLLVGWHIDIQQDQSLIDLISETLISMAEFWAKDMAFSVELLKQFFEDMEAYNNELAGTDDMSQPSVESSSPEQCLSKLTALIRVFTTVLISLGTNFSPSRSAQITPAFVKEVVNRIINFVFSANDVAFSEDLLIAGNQCMMELSRCLQGHLASHSSLVAMFVLRQLDDEELCSPKHASSIVKLLMQVVEDLQSSLPTQFVQELFALDSPVLTLRYMASEKLLSQLIKLYNSFLAIRNIPLLDVMYRLIIADLDQSFKHLERCLSQPSYSSIQSEDSAPLNPLDPQVAIIFDLNVLSQIANTSKAIIGMWSPNPSLFSLLKSKLGSLTSTMASEYPAIHYSLVYALFQDCRSNRNYLPGGKGLGGTSVSKSVTAVNLSSSSSSTSIYDILSLLTRQMQAYMLPGDICRLIQRWVDYIVENVKHTDREAVPMDKFQAFMDPLACQLLALTFSKEHSIRLDNAAVLKSLFQHRLISDKVIKKCVPECLMRLSDTRGEIRAAYSALLEVVPTHIMTSFSQGVTDFQPPNGRKWLEGLRNCKGTWHARRIHMTKQSQVTFHGHHFKAIMGFIMHGYAPSKHLPDDWLERMYHSCQHRRPPVPESLDHPELHPLLMSHLVCNCDAVLWFWATYESAQYCLLARLRTPLGLPADTFGAIEAVLQGYAQEVESRDGKHSRDTPSSFSGHMGAGLGPRHYTVHLRAVLLLQFMEHLDKLMYNAYEGSCVTLPPVPKSVRSFFRKNVDTCLEWLSHMRGCVVSIAIHAGLPAVAVRHGYAALRDLSKQPNYLNENPEFWKMVVNVTHALLLMGSWQTIQGLGVWVGRMVGAVPPFIMAAEEQAKSSYETACEEYLKALKVLDVMQVSTNEKDHGGPTSHLKAVLAIKTQFIVNRICECYMKVSDWKEAEEWSRHVSAMHSQSSEHSKEISSAFKLNYDLNQIKALGWFDAGDLSSSREYVERQSDPRHASRDPEVYPLWDPGQLLRTSHLLLLKAVTFQAGGDDGSGSDNNSVTSEGDYDPKSSKQRWLKLSSAYAESPLRVGCLEWPLRVSPAHSLQLQSAAALKALNPIKSRHAQAVSSGLLLYAVPFKSLNPACHDNGIWNEALRISSHLARASSFSDVPGADPYTPAMLLELYRLARNQGNLKHADNLIHRQIMERTGASENAIEVFKTASDIPPMEKLRVMREFAKLNAAQGQTPQAIDFLTSSVVDYCKGQQGAKTSGPLGSGSELSARSLLVMVKWLQSDSRLMQAIWGSEPELSQKMSHLLKSESECRKARLGLYMSASPSESYELFQPDESLARFDKHEYSMGQLLHLATMHCPDLAKAWWSLAGWCYRIGRKNLEALSATGTAALLDHEQHRMDEIMKQVSVSGEQRTAVIGVLGQVHISDSADEDLKAKEDVSHVDVEEDSKSLRGQLLSVCPPLEQLPPSSMDDLLGIWSGVRVRMFMHYQLSARAYFIFLRLSGSQAGSSPALDDMNVTASLRLLRLLVKYAGELKAELESGFNTTPTKPWKGIIPQLFSRLNHPENNVRQSVSDLLCRVGHDSPHFIIYPAIVGASRKAEKKSESVSADGLLQEDADERDNNNYEMGSRELLGDGFTPSDPTMSSEDQESSPVELSNLEKSLSIIIDSLKQQNAGLVKDVEDLVSELCRITLLWDEMWLAALMQRQGEVHRRLMQIDQETKRTMSFPHLSSKEKEAIMKEKYMATMKPLLWVLEHLAFITSQPAETPNERNFQGQYGSTINSAIQRLKNPVHYNSPQSVWEPFKEFQQMLIHRAQKRMQNSLSLNEISPHLAAISSSLISMPGHNQGDEPVTLESFQLEVSVLPTKTKPKKISMIGSDGRKHTYLFKGLEDLHLDERIMQFMDIINNMFARAHKHQTQLYLAKDYAVIPLGARSGLIQWVDAVTPLFGIYKRWQQREAYAKALEQADGQQPMPMPLQVMKPNELFYSKIIPLLKENGLSEQTPRKEWPHHIQLRVLQELMSETPSDLLAKEIWCASSCASEWWSATQTYCRSTAVMCMIGYIIGLGDRHLDNLLVEFATGQVVHVDYNVCFEKGQSLRVPERVPFRMTQNIEAALGFTGVDGLFRISCEDILRILRRGRETLLTLLEAFVYDPLIDWTQSEDAAFPLAVTPSKDQAGRPSRKEMEREVASGLLVTRLSESGPYWQRNRESLCSVLLSLELYFDEIAKTGEKLASYTTIFTRLDRQVEILRDAVNTPDHPLISMQEKLSEQSRMMAEHKRLVSDLKDQYNDACDWNLRYKAAFKGIHGSELGAFISAMQKPLELGPPGHEPAVDFLGSIGLNQAVDACDQLEQELIDLLKRRREVLINALEALHQYRNITAQFHADYLKQSRSYLWEMCIEPVVEGPITHESLQKVIDEFENRLRADARPENLIKAVDGKFRKSAQECHIKYSKIFERSKQLTSSDKSKLDAAVHDASIQLSQFCQDNPTTGPTSLACFIIVALCPLSRRWLFMEHTAQAARERLSDLTSKDGDWFLDELCTMSGNVSQMIGLLEMCLTNMGHEIQPNTVLYSTIAAVNAVHKVYSSMQDLFNKFLSMILPEAINSILSEEETTLEMFDTVSSFTLTGYPDTPILKALELLTEGLRECSHKSAPASLSMTAAVEELRSKFSSILAPSGRSGGVTGEMKMTPAQVILNSMYGLFQITEMSTIKLCESIHNVVIPEDWEAVDLVKQTSTLMHSSSNPALADELLFVRKAQAIIEFCLECKSLLKAFKLEARPSNDPPESPGYKAPTPPGTPSRHHKPHYHIPTESSFGLPIRRYIAETLICHVLGQPSYSLACFLISTITQYLKIKLPQKQGHVMVPVEEVCRLANDHYQKALPMPIIQHARTLFSQHDVAWRDGDRIRRLVTNLDNSKLSLQRNRGIATRFQWLHEEVLSSSDSHFTWIGTQRVTILSTIKKVLADNVSNSLTSVLDKINSQQFRIGQRLQWAAGANPALNSVIDEFERAMSQRKQILQHEEELYVQICEFCEAVVHLEYSHTRMGNMTDGDKDTIILLRRCADVTLKLKLFAEQLSQVSDLLTQIDLPEDGAPITLEWMHSRQEEINMERARIFSEKRADTSKLTKHKEMVLSELEKLRGLNRHHRKLMVEVWPHLTSLARLEEPPPMGQIQPGPRGFINLQNKFGEEVRSFIQSAQDLIAADMSLAAKPSITSKFRPDDFAQMKRAAENLSVLAESLLGQLLSFTDQLFQGQSCANLKWNTPPIIENLLPKSISSVSIASTVQNAGGGQTSAEGDSAQQQTQAKSIYRSSQGIVRDKRTGKALQEQNSYAVGVWRRVKAKLDGRDFDANYRLSVAEQVKSVIEEATSLANLCQLYEGWTPWV